MAKTLLQRFEEKHIPEPNSGCWLWGAAISPSPTGTHPYGILQDGDGVMRMAHRIGYELHRGSIPVGMHLDHLCRTTLCVNPEHLEPVTAKENIRRGRTAEAARHTQLRKTHCPQGHPFSGENLYMKPNGRRECRQCVRDSGIRYRAKQKKVA